MRIVHLSDLHFGTETGQIADDLTEAIREAKPDLIVVSGDFTQIASSSEFKTARDYISKLPAPVFCVPGNHDIPRFDVWDRLFSPYKRYRKYIEEDLKPVFENDRVIVAGINSARPVLPHWNWANGAISHRQLSYLKDVYTESKAKYRVCVFHHPVQQAFNAPLDTVVFGAKNTLRALNDFKVDLVLTGHVHHASVTTLGDLEHRTIYLSASTALSTRLREQENGFNLIEFLEDNMAIHIYAHDGKKFALQENYSQKTS